MTKKTWRQDATTGKLYEVQPSRDRPKGPLIMGDIESFVSPIDGTLITSRPQLKQHMRQHNVTPRADYTEHWEKSKKEREAFYTGEHKKTDRYSREMRNDIADSIEQASSSGFVPPHKKQEHIKELDDE